MAPSYVYLFIFTHVREFVARPANVVRTGQTKGVDAFSLSRLSELGYLQSRGSIGQISNLEEITRALKSFQSFAGIPVSGILDDKTREYMAKPRCGMPDVGEHHRRVRRYNHHGSRWHNTNLTWALENRNNDGLSNYQVRHLLTRAFNKKWSDVTNVNFKELVNRPDNTAQIRVRFERGVHGDPAPFDGPGGYLAHAFYPNGINTGICGDIHFDDDEIFIINKRAVGREKKLLWIAVHEIGHSLGLAHSDERGAIMFPYYEHIETRDLNLTYDDILGIQMIYGGKSGTGVTLPPTLEPPTEPPRKCVDTMTAAFVGYDNRLHIVNNNQLYHLHEAPKQGIANGPLPISSYFEGVDRVDAVFQHHYYRSHTVFHGRTFSIFEENQVRYGGERKIRDGFQLKNGQLDSVDAAFVWPGTERLYIFKGDQYWRMRGRSGSRDYVADEGYPQSIAVRWRGLPKTIDSAFVWTNKQIYFIKGNLYYRWNERKQMVHSGYPVTLKRSFLKCPAW